MRVAVTGASGFIGSALVQQLAADGHHVLAYVRDLIHFDDTLGINFLPAPELGYHGDWRFGPQSGIDVLVHTAARVHVAPDAVADQLSEFRMVNLAGTECLARQAALANVKRFVFLSSIKVNGECTNNGQFFTANDIVAPQDPYGISKHEAEKSLHKIAAETGMEVVIIRPPLVYGQGVKANFESMMRWLSLRVPLPMASVTHNRRSLVSLDNLIDLIVTCVSHPSAANETFLVSDGEDLSTAELLRRLGIAMDCPARLFYLPTTLLKLATTWIDKPDFFLKLCGSMQVDITKTRRQLSWTPPVSVDEGLRRAAYGLRF